MKRRRQPAVSGLRTAAERRLRGVTPDDAAEADARRLVHELQVHQVELEMQNDELLAARTQTEGALARYTELFDFAPIGYFRVLADSQIREANFAGARLLRAPRGDFLGRGFDELVCDGDRQRFRAFLVSLLTAPPEEARSASAEFTLDLGPRAACIVRVTGSSLLGKAPSALLAVEDVTAGRVAEERLQEEARRREEFLATLSHELRNPLAPIRNAIVLLQRSTPGGEQARTALAVLDRQVTHLTRIIDDLLDVTRIARGKIRLQRERIDLAAHVARTLDDHRAAFDAAGVRLGLERDARPCWVDADPSRIAQVLGNLLGNALKFTNDGGRVEVAVRRDGDEAALLVRDTGVGITPELLERIFEPFSQAPQTLDRTRGGLGLGLALVKGLVQLHGGTVVATSAGAGRGTTFAVRLPLAPAPGVVARPHDVSLGAPRRVLVVDDNADAAMTLKDVLELGGHDVRVALDGPAALRAAEEFRPDVVICDIGLPGMDGYEVARRLRATPARGGWLVAMSGYAAPEDLQRARDAGFDRHVAKPADIRALERVFAEAPAAPAASGQHA